MIICTSRHIVEDLANRNTSPILLLFCWTQNSQHPENSALPKSSWHARLKEQKSVLGGITRHPRGEKLELANPPRAYGMCGQILGHFYKEVANHKSCAHKSWSRWLTPLFLVSWGSLQHYWCFPSYTWYSSTIVGMWTTFDGDHFATSLVHVWITGLGDLCRWPFPSSKCNASIISRPTELNTALCYKWDTSVLCMKVSHYDIPLDSCVE